MMRGTQSLEWQAERLKRFFAAACEENGLDVSRSASRRLRGSEAWLVVCYAKLPSRRNDDPSVILASTVTRSCPWPGQVHVWSAFVKESGQRVFMHGRESVKPSHLVEELMQTVHECEVVASAVRAGIASPYWFHTSMWSE
jgi:hypothetical protein